MSNKELNRIHDENLEFVSGGANVISGYKYLVIKNDENKIFKYEVIRGDGSLMSKHIFESFAEDAAMKYRNEEFNNSVKRYENYLKYIDNKIRNQ